MNQRFTRRVLSYLFIQTLAIGLTLAARAGDSIRLLQDVTPLEFGKPVERELKAGEGHTYRINLTAGQFIRVIVDQRGIDVVVTLFRPDGGRVVEVDSPNGTQGPEPISAIAEVSGGYGLEVRSLEKEAAPGRYEIRVEELRAATGQDKVLIAADRAFREAESLRSQGAAEQLPLSVEKYKEALSLYRTAGDSRGEAETLSGLGAAYYSSGKRQEALDSFARALRLYRALKDVDSEAKTLTNLGTLHNDSGDKQKAIDYYSQAVPIYHAAGDPAGEAAARSGLAEIYNDTGEGWKALEQYTAALPIYRTIGNQKAEARVLNNIAVGDAKLGERQKALEIFAQLLTLRRDLRDPKGEAQTLSDMGLVYQDLDRKLEALEKYAGALTLYRSAGDRSGAAATLNSIGTIYDSHDERRKALEIYAEALALYRAVSDQAGEAATLSNIGKVYGSQGKTREALETLEQALTLARGAGYRLGLAGVLNNIGKVYDDLGEKQKALEYYGQALPLLHGVEYGRHEAVTLNNIGKVYDDLGDKQRALSFFFKALSALHAIGDRSGQAATLNNIGAVYDSLGEKQKAIDYFTEELTLHAADDRGAAAQGLNYLGGLYDDAGQKQKALETFAQALALYRAVENISGQAAVLNNIGSVNDDLGQKQKALDAYAQALALARSVGNRGGEARTLNNIGAVYYSMGEKRKALDYYFQSLPLRRAIGDQSGEARTLANLGVVYDDLGDKVKALDFYEQATSSFEGIRTAATIEEIKIGLAEAAATAYERKMLLLVSTGQSERAFDASERARARAFLDQIGNIRPNLHKSADAGLLREEQTVAAKINSLRSRLDLEQAKAASSQDAAEISSLKTEIAAGQRRLEDLITQIKLTNPEYVTLRSTDTLKLSEIQKLLDKDTSLCSYFITPDKTLAFVITRDSFNVVEMPVKRDEIIAAVNWFRSFDELTESHPQALKQLYDWLIAPLKPHIKTPILGIIPHGILHYLPFAALTDGKLYFGEQYSLFYLPSASILKFIREKDKPVGTKLLAVAQSRIEGLQPLEHADEEVRAITRLYDTEAFSAGSMSKSDFMNRVRDFDLIHIAAHTELNLFNPLFTRIVLGSDKNERESARGLEVREIYELDLSKIGLVVLSACETQLGPYSRGDDIVGLNRAFIYAGSPSVVASLWTVDDESTSYLMRSFYTNLKRGMNKAGALRAAQSETRQRYPHPYYWAGFVLTGAPGMN